MSRRHFLIIILLGLPALATIGLRLRLFPPPHDNTIVVTIERASSFAEQIEREITIPLEDQIAILDGISSIRSHSTRGRSSIEVYFDPLVTPQLGYIRVREAVERVEHLLPGDAARPRIEHRTPDDRPLFIVALTATSGLDFGEVGRAFGAIEGSGRVAIGGDTKPELVIEVAPRTLAGAGVPIETIVRALQSDAVRGGFGPPQGQVFTLGNDYRDSDYIRGLGIGGLELGQVATIGERMSQPDTISRVNAQRRVVLSIYPTDDTHPVRLCRRLRRHAARYQSAEILYDYGRQIERTLGRGLLALLVAIAAATPGLKWLQQVSLPHLLLLLLAAGLGAAAATRLAAFDLLALLGLVASLSLVLDLYLRPDNMLFPDPRARIVPATLFHTALLGGLVGLMLLMPSARAVWVAVLLPALGAILAAAAIGLIYQRGKVSSPGVLTTPAHTQPPAYSFVPALPRRRIRLLLAIGAMAALVGMAQVEVRPFDADDTRAIFFRAIFRAGFGATLEATRPLEEALTELGGVRFVSALHNNGTVRFYVALARRSAVSAARRLIHQHTGRIPEAFVLFAEAGERARRLQVTLRGDDVLQLRGVATELGAALAALDGVEDVIADFAATEPALALRIDLQRLGSISPRRVHSALYWTLARPIAAKRHTPDGEGDIRVVVPHQQRATLQDIVHLPIVASDGTRSEIGSLVRVAEQPQVDSVRRIDRRRSVTLTIRANRATDIDRLRNQVENQIEAQIEAQIENNIATLGTGTDGAAELDFVVEAPKSDRTTAQLASRLMLPAIAVLIGWSLLLVRLNDQRLTLHTLAVALCAALPAILFFVFMPISVSALVGLLSAIVGLFWTLPQWLHGFDRGCAQRSIVIYLLWMIPLAAIDVPLLAPFALTALSVRLTALLLVRMMGNCYHKT